MHEKISAVDDLKHTLALLKTEQEEDRKQYREKILESSLSERRNLGVSWYPIVIKEAYYGVGDRLIVEIERTANLEINHQFQFGSLASLFSNYHNEGADNPSVSGIITSVRGNVLKMSLSVDELPEWTTSGKLGLDLLFDESSYKEMEMAISQVIKADKSRLASLREVILGQDEARFSNENIYQSNSLNEFQNKAFSNVCRSKDVAVIHGPPGTGKTTTLIECILYCIKTEQQVLVCAPSNTAVDLLTEGLAARGANVLRMGNPARISDLLVTHTLDYKISSHPNFKQIKDFRKRAGEYRIMGSKYKRNFGKEDRDQRRLLFDEAKKLQQEAEKIEKYITEDFISRAQVITATLVGSANYLIREKRYKTVFIDEAGQALEPACWIPISKGDRVIMAGDHQQLPPTIKSAEAARKGLSQTLMEKSIKKKEVSSMLKVQYRMHELIMNFPNQMFYGGHLIASDSVKNKTLVDRDSLPSIPFEFIDTAGCGYEEKLDKENQGISNPEEADLLLKRIKLLIPQLAEDTFSIGIISPYRSQINYLKERIEEDEIFLQYPKLSVNTVDGFQGQERDIICISLVRSNGDGEIGFLADIRRMNVAITRAKMKLIIVGDSATLGQHPFYSSFIQYAESVQGYQSAWEYIY